MEIGHNKLCEFVRITVKNNMRKLYSQAREQTSIALSFI